MAERKKLGDLMKEAGLIDDFQLEAALSHQRNWGGKLGSIIVELEFAREEDIARVIAEKLHIPYVNLFDPEIPADTVNLLKPEIAKKFGVMPVKKDGKSLTLAMSDPMDIDTMDNIRFNTGMTIKPVLSMASEIKDAIRKYYDNEPVTRKDVPSFRETTKTSGKMELVREIPDFATAEWNQQQQQAQQLQDLEKLRNDVKTQRIVIEALSAILIEKGLILRNELARVIEQKKMGI
ncbi:MAG: hypothetical protein OEW15_03265 [Nitrospirota bacterium]|nr:hypothetical protein [Nitrospirota bacterium]